MWCMFKKKSNADLIRLQHFVMSQHILEMVYKNLVERVVCFNMTMLEWTFAS